MRNISPDLEPFEAEVVGNVLDTYGRKHKNPDDAESAAVADGKLERDAQGRLRPKGWQPAAKPEPKKQRKLMTPDADPRVRQEREDAAKREQRKRGVGQFIVPTPIKGR